jgi:hypothetical protein
MKATTVRRCASCADRRVRMVTVSVSPGSFAGDRNFCGGVGSLAGLPQRALAREALIAQVEIARLLRDTIRDLERRAKRGKR